MTSTDQQARPTPPVGFAGDDEFVNVSAEKFTKVPKASHRRGPHRPRRLLSVAVLTLYLSNKTGWKLPNAASLAAEWHEGEDAIRAAVADLETHGWIVRFRDQNRRGRWMWRTFVADDPAALDPVRQYARQVEEYHAGRKAAKAAESGADASGGSPAQPTSDGSTFPQVAPDGGYRDPVDRDPANRDPVDRDPVTAMHKDQETVLGDQEENTSPSGVTPVTAARGTAGGGGGALPISAEIQTQLEHAVAEAAQIRRGWTAKAIRSALIGAIVEDDRDPADAAAAMLELAADTAGTLLPSRIRQEAWWALRDRRQHTAAASPRGGEHHADAPPTWCGECPKSTRMVTAGSLDAHAADPRRPVPCPNCHPAAGQVAA